MQRTYLSVLVATLVVIGSVSGASAASFADAGVDPNTGLGGLAQETATLGPFGGGIPETVTTYGGQPGWHVVVTDRAALKDWANASDQREILRYDEDQNTSVIAAPPSHIGTGVIEQLFEKGLHGRDYVQSVAVVQEVETPDPPEPVSRNEFDPPETGLIVSFSSGLPIIGAPDYPMCGIAFTENANRTSLSKAKTTINATGTPSGDGVRVAVLDDGVTNDTLYGDRIVAGYDFVADQPATAANGWQNVSSATGHGSWVASAIAANASNDSYDGVAPSANLVIGKTLGENGGTSADIVAGLDWACGDQDADIVSMSLGSQLYSAPIDAAVQDCVDSGTVVVIAAGNSADSVPVGISSPADSLGENPQQDGIITVAATNVSENVSNAGVAHFSQRGPDPGQPSTTFGATRGADPTIAAPGMEITAKTAAGKRTLSGTSMATPLVSGAAAALLGANPHLTPGEVEQRIGHGATPMPKAGVHEVGAGMINLEGALETDPNDEDYYVDQEKARRNAPERRDAVYEAVAADARSWMNGVEEAIGL